MESKNRAIAKRCFTMGFFTPAVCFWYDSRANQIDGTDEEIKEMTKDPSFNKIDRAMYEEEISSLIFKTKKYSQIRMFVEVQCKRMFKMFAPRDSVNRLLLRLDNGVSGYVVSVDLSKEIVEQFPQKPMWIDTKEDVPLSFEGYRVETMRALAEWGVQPDDRDKVEFFLRKLKQVEKMRDVLELDNLLDGYKKICAAIAVFFFPYIRSKIESFQRILEALCNTQIDNTVDVKEVEEMCRNVFKPVVEDKIVDKVIQLHMVMIGPRGKGYHIQVDSRLYQSFKSLGYDTEGFSGPYNHYFDRYYSSFKSDRYFGSLGNFFSSSLKGNILVNPPYDDKIIDSMFKVIRRSRKARFLVFLPNTIETQKIIGEQGSYINHLWIIPKDMFRFEQFWDKYGTIGEPTLFEPVHDIVLLSMGDDRIDEITNVLKKYERVIREDDSIK